MPDTERVLEEEGSGPPTIPMITYTGDTVVKVFLVGVCVGMVLGLFLYAMGTWAGKALAFLMYGA